MIGDNSIKKEVWTGAIAGGAYGQGSKRRLKLFVTENPVTACHDETESRLLTWKVVNLRGLDPLRGMPMKGPQDTSTNRLTLAPTPRANGEENKLSVTMPLSLNPDQRMQSVNEWHPTVITGGLV